MPWVQSTILPSRAELEVPPPAPPAEPVRPALAPALPPLGDGDEPPAPPDLAVASPPAPGVPPARAPPDPVRGDDEVQDTEAAVVLIATMTNKDSGTRDGCVSMRGLDHLRRNSTSENLKFRR